MGMKKDHPRMEIHPEQERKNPFFDTRDYFRCFSFYSSIDRFVTCRRKKKRILSNIRVFGAIIILNDVLKTTMIQATK